MMTRRQNTSRAANKKSVRSGPLAANATADGVLARFDGPARALRCTIAIMESVQEIGLEVRAGLHTGQVETRGDRLAGIAVHIASRVSRLALPSEVLASSSVKGLVDPASASQPAVVMS